MLKKLLSRVRRPVGEIAWAGLPGGQLGGIGFGMCASYAHYAQEDDEDAPSVKVDFIDPLFAPLAVRGESVVDRVLRYTQGTTCVLPHECVIVVMERPNLPESDFDAHFRWELAGLVAFDADSAGIDYYDLQQNSDGAAAVCVCAISGEVLERYRLSSFAKSFRSHHRKSLAITTPEAGMRGLISPHYQDEGCLGIYLSERGTIILACYQGEIIMIRQSQAIINALDGEAGHLLATERVVRDCEHVLNYVRGHFRHVPMRDVVVFSDLSDPALRTSIETAIEHNTALRGVAYETLAPEAPTAHYALALGLLLDNQTSKSN